MQPKTRIQLALTVLAILALAACTPGQSPLPPLRPTTAAQPTAAIEQPTAAVAEPAATTEVPAAPEPQATAPAGNGPSLALPSAEQCNGLAQVLSEALSRATGQATPLEITQSEAPLTDPTNGATGTGCRASAVGTGEQFGSPDAVMTQIVAVFTEGGWQEDMQLAAGGPTGIGSGFRAGDLVSMAFAGWQPDAATSCRSDRPISECQVPPEHQAYTITLDTAQTVGYGGAAMPNPASQNCETQGGALTIQQRPDGGQYGVCVFTDNMQCEEWALMRGECPVGGVKVTGFTTPAATYCAITGGTYAVSSNGGQANERGTCALPDGRRCEVWSYYLGGCASPVIGMANPASQNCVAKGGKMQIEERPDGGQYGVCVFTDNMQCEEWALLRGQCPVGGVKVTGYTTPAATYCAITGGTYTVTGNSGQPNEAGTCALFDGTQCDVWSYYQGACQAGGAQ